MHKKRTMTCTTYDTQNPTSSATVINTAAITVNVILSNNNVSLSSLGGGFFLSCENCGTLFDHSFTARAFFFFFEVEI